MDSSSTNSKEKSSSRTRASNKDRHTKVNGRDRRVRVQYCVLLVSYNSPMGGYITEEMRSGCSVKQKRNKTRRGRVWGCGTEEKLLFFPCKFQNRFLFRTAPLHPCSPSSLRLLPILFHTTSSSRLFCNARAHG